MLTITEELLEDPQFQASMAAASEMAKDFLAKAGIESDSIWKDLEDGLTIAQAKGLSREDLEVIYTVGFNMLNSGELDKAEDTFLTLCMIDQLEAKNHYCLGIVRQMKRNWHMAHDDFMRFLALDATNPEGYLRLGECYMALGHHDDAKESFEFALAEAKKGNGPDTAVQQAERALQQFH